MLQNFLMLETRAERCAAEARINDIPVCELRLTRILDHRPVHEYLLPSRNQFKLIVQPGPIPSLALKSGDEPFVPLPETLASLRLLSMPKGTFDDDPGVTELFRLEWKPAAGEQLETPVVLEQELEIADAGYEWERLAGEPFDDSTLRDVVLMLQTCREAFAHRDPEPFLRLAQPRFRASLIAYGLEIPPEIEMFRQDFAEICAAPGFEMQPLNPEQLDLRICGHGKLVECVDRSWEPALRTVKLANGVTPARYPAKAAILNGATAIVL